MQFNVAQLLKDVTGATRTYDIDTPTVSELDGELKIVSAITGRVKLLRTGRDILVTGALHTTIQRACGRCLADFTAPISLELEEEFFPTLDIVTGAVLPTDSDADEANRIDEHHILDLWEVVRQEILLVSDDFLYCRPDCKGLCPHCGQDRNINPCNCQEEIIDPRWAGLLTLPPTEDDS
ncbi:MAG: DUF177 domain-containing protein [Chloroflexota bacterium]